MSIFARNGRRDGFAAARNGEFSQTSPQSPLRAPLGYAAELGIVFSHTGSSAPTAPRLRLPAARCRTLLISGIVGTPRTGGRAADTRIALPA